jgi:hypothetical protein
MSGSLGGPSSINRGGTLFFKVNGQQYDLAGTFTIKKGGKVNEPVVGPDGVHGYKTKYVAPLWNCELQDGDAVLMSTLQSISGETLTAELDNGKTYILISAFTTGETSLDVVEAKIKCDFAGLSDQELPS